MHKPIGGQQVAHQLIDVFQLGGYGAKRIITEELGHVVISGEDGVFMNRTPFKISGLDFFGQIRRHTSPDCQTHCVSSLRSAS